MNRNGQRLVNVRLFLTENVQRLMVKNNDWYWPILVENDGPYRWGVHFWLTSHPNLWVPAGPRGRSDGNLPAAFFATWDRAWVKNSPILSAQQLRISYQMWCLRMALQSHSTKKTLKQGPFWPSSPTTCLVSCERHGGIHYSPVLPSDSTNEMVWKTTWRWRQILGQQLGTDSELMVMVNGQWWLMVNSCGGGLFIHEQRKSKAAI